MILKLYYNGTTLFDSTTDQYKATEINLTEQVNTSGTLKFTLPTTNPNINAPAEITPGIELYEDNVLVFEGRVLYTDDDIVGNRTFTCEGSLAYLLDSIVRPNTTQDTTVQEYLQYLITQHNSQVEEAKKFQLGTVTVTNSTDNVYRIDNDYANTLTVIQEKLVNRLGGYLRVRMLNGVRYLDYLESYDTQSNQVIEFQKNILDISNHISAENVITALIPLGAKDDATDLPITIKSVNDGKDYIFDQTAVNLFGWIYGTQTWDDVTLPQNLLTKAQEALSNNIASAVSISVTAFDLSLVNADIDKIYLGDSVQVISQPQGLDTFFIVKKREKKYLDPANSSIVLDTVIARNTDQMTSTDKTLQQAVNVTIPSTIQNMIDYQTSLITGGKGGYVVFGMNDQGQPEEIYIMDQPTINDAVNLIRMNKNGIGFSNSGVNGPYTSAWTIDGKFNADFITTGTLVGITIQGNTINGATINGGTINGTSINTDQDLTVGNNIYINTDVQTQKYIYFTDNSFIRMFLTSGWEYLVMESNYRTSLRSTGVGQSANGQASVYTWTTEDNIIHSGMDASNGSGTSCSFILQGENGNIVLFANGTFSGNVQYTVSSDKRLKENIEDIDLTGLLDIINVKKFNMINNPQKTVGVIAQDFIGTPYEDIILRKDENGYYSVDYNVILMAIAQQLQKDRR